MESIGCSSAAPKSGRNEVSIPLPSGEVSSFDCVGVSRAKVRTAISHFRNSLSEQSTATPPTLQTYYEDVTVYFQCEVTHYWNYVPAMGEYVYAYFTVDGCWITEIVREGGGGGGGGGGDGNWVNENGDPVPPPSPSYEPPIVADTVCLELTDDRSVLRGIAEDTFVVQGPLNDLAIQDSLRAVFTDSYGTLQAPLPMSQRRELGGVIVYNPVADTYSFVRVPSMPAWESHCTYALGPAKIHGVLVGVFHTHPIRDNEVYDCPLTGQYNQQGNAEGSGGGSPQDWDSATANGVPMYTMDPDRMWRLEPNTPTTARAGNTERWVRGTTNQCSARAPF